MAKKKQPILMGLLDTRAKLKMVTWVGWAVYYWDHAHCVTLFSHKPKESKDEYRSDIEWGEDLLSDNCTPEFLQACGIKPDDFGSQEFYYGDKRNGYHPPFKIQLTIPRVIAHLINLYV